MKRLAGLSTLALLASLGSGCSWLWGDEGYFRDRAREYQTASQQPPMQVPNGMQTRSLEPLLAIPAQVPTLTEPGAFSVPRPPLVQVRAAEQGDTVSLSQARRYDAPTSISRATDASGQPLLQLESDFNRAWASIGRALDAADVRVDDLDRSQGLYYINLAEGAKRGDGPGFFARLFGRGERSSEARAERYQVRVMDIGDRVRISVERDADTPAPADVARRVLGLIQDNLG